MTGVDSGEPMETSVHTAISVSTVRNQSVDMKPEGRLFNVIAPSEEWGQVKLDGW